MAECSREDEASGSRSAAAMAEEGEARTTTTMVLVSADDRAPGLLPPRKRLLAGLKLHSNISLHQPAPSPSPPPPAAAPAPAAAPPPIASSLLACSSCGLALPPLLLHRLSSSYHCSPCVLSSHKHMYCSLCLQVLPSPPPPCFTCRQCHRLSHLHCARQQSASACSDFSMALCVDCRNGRSGCVSQSTSSMAGEELPYAVDEHQSPGKKQRTNLWGEGGSKCTSCDLIQQTPVDELPSIYYKALAAAKVVAAIAEKAASDAKMRAMATAAAAARAAARAKLALDDAYRAGQEEATATGKLQELVQEGERSSNSGAHLVMIKQPHPAMNDESTRHKSGGNVPRNSRSSAPVYKRRTLSAIVASEASRMLANSTPHQGNSPLPAVKQQSKRHRSSNAVVRPDSSLAADASKRSASAPANPDNPSSSSHAKQQFTEPSNAVRCETTVNSSSAAFGRTSAASTTPSSSPLGKPHDSPSPAKLGDLSSSIHERGSVASTSKAPCPVTHPADAFQRPVSVSTSTPQRRKTSPSTGSSLRSVQAAPGTPSSVPCAAKAQDLNLAAAKILAGFPEVEPSCSPFAKSTPTTVNMRTPSIQNADTLSCLETSPVTLDDGGTTRRGNLIDSTAAPDVLKLYGRPLLQSRSSFSAEHGKSHERLAECSCSRSIQSPCADPGLLEIVLPVVDAVERETLQPGVEKDGAGYSKEGAFIGGLVSSSIDRSLARDAYGGPPTSPRNKVREGMSFGGTKNQMDNLPRLQFGKSTCLSEEQREISTSVASAYSVPMPTAALTRVPTGGCSS